MLPKSERPHFARTNLKEKEKIDRGKQKLLLLNLKRICYKRISGYLSDFKKIVQHEANVINSAFRRVDRNIQFCKIMSWKKLVFFGKLKQRQNRILKFMIIASLRYEKLCLLHSFRCISNFASKKIYKNSNKIFTAKANIMKNVLLGQFKKLLVYSFTKIRSRKMIQEHLKNKHKLFQYLLSKIVKERKFYAWSRILGVSSPEHEDVEHQLGEITKERDSLRKQLARKSKQMENLENQMTYKNQQIISYNTIRTDSRVRNNSLQNSRRSFKSIGSNKRGSSKDLSEKKSQMGSFENNTSILSWLNGSFMSIKSGKSNKSKSINGFQCYCKYRQKYNQYKAETASLKNQLQIIKSELQVTKDLNDHLQFQISNLCMSENIQSPELQLLRKEVKQLKKQKDIMKDKALKNQKYIANLKYEFKMKIENLYRNLKKANN